MSHSTSSSSITRQIFSGGSSSGTLSLCITNMFMTLLEGPNPHQYPGKNNSNDYIKPSFRFSQYVTKWITRIVLCEKAHPLRWFQEPMYYYLICVQHKQCSHQKSIDWTFLWNLSIKYRVKEEFLNDIWWAYTVSPIIVLAGQPSPLGSHPNLPQWHGHLFDINIFKIPLNELTWPRQWIKRNTDTYGGHTKQMELTR